MERTFKQELDLAMEHKINVLKLTIANEVCSFLEGNWWFESYLESNDQATIELFERICERVQDVYLKVDNSYSLSDIVDAIIRLLQECKKPLEEINKYMVIEYIQDNF